MLESTFCHIPGVGLQSERALWEQGCSSWQKYREAPQEYSIGGVARNHFDKFVERSIKNLAEREFTFFSQTLGTREAWRAWPEFRSSCAYLDIETDGGQSGSSITTIGVYDGSDFKCLIKGRDLDEFPSLIARFGMIVTFFGTGFDVPMLKRAFPEVRFDHIHLDLCHALKKVGYRGGLKSIEKQLGIARGSVAEGLSGYDAIRLWGEYMDGEDASLETLIEYNREDVVNLETLADIAYRKLRNEVTLGTSLSESLEQV